MDLCLSAEISGCTEVTEFSFHSCSYLIFQIALKLTFLIVSLNVVEESAEAGLHGFVTLHPVQRGAHPFSGVVSADLVVLFLENTHTHTPAAAQDVFCFCFQTIRTFSD